MSLKLDKSSKNDGPKKFPVPLPRKQKQLYGGIFSGWWMSEEGQYGPSLVIKALVTHAPAGSKGWEKLELITQARAYLGIAQWYNPKKNQASYPVAFLSAVSGMDPAILAEMKEAELEDLLNECVGNGFLFSASIEQTTAGHLVNAIDKKTFDAPDTPFGKLADAMKPRLEISVSEQDGAKYVSKPLPEYQTEEESAQYEPGDRGDGSDGFGDGFGDDLDDEIPF